MRQEEEEVEEKAQRSRSPWYIYGTSPSRRKKRTGNFVLFFFLSVARVPVTYILYVGRYEKIRLGNNILSTVSLDHRSPCIARKPALFIFFYFFKAIARVCRPAVMNRTHIFLKGELREAPFPGALESPCVLPTARSVWPHLARAQIWYFFLSRGCALIARARRRRDAPDHVGNLVFSAVELASFCSDRDVGRQ